MDEKEYIAERLENEIDWYEKKSNKNKRNYYLSRIIELVSAALIPFLINFLTRDTELLKTTVEVLGIIVIVSSGLISIFQFNELWTEYRTNAESLKHEKYLYLSSAKPYDKANKYKLLVERVEKLISTENSHWLDISSTE
ncbi:MAG: DUF4231 domain-containing protein [Anaerolineaceae bacterium]|nr:DUF4231 domain-containing protein [Anaerolineaceae bacterium]